MDILGGVEEAGRGPVIGPMVMAGVVVEKGVQEKLKEIGVKDSKLLSPKQREQLFPKIKDLVKDYKIIILDADDVDAALNDSSMNLNKLEAKTSAKLIEILKPDTVILDCPSTNPPAYVEQVESFFEKDNSSKIIAEHKADLNYPVVSAASILAKVTRDKLVKELEQQAKDILGVDVKLGSGYPSDPNTKKFLELYWDKLDSVKGGFFRKTWKTYTNIANKKGQKNLADF